MRHTYWSRPSGAHLLEHLSEHTYWNTSQSTPIGIPIEVHLLEHLSEHTYWNTYWSTLIGTPIRAHLLNTYWSTLIGTPIRAHLLNTYWSTLIGTPIRAHLLEHIYHYTLIGARLPENVCRYTPSRVQLLEHIDRSTSTAARLLEHTYEHIYWSKPIVAHLLESVYRDTAIHISETTAALSSCRVTKRYDSLKLTYCYELHQNQRVQFFYLNVNVSCPFHKRDWWGVTRVVCIDRLLFSHWLASSRLQAWPNLGIRRAVQIHSPLLTLSLSIWPLVLREKNACERRTEKNVFQGGSGWILEKIA